MSTSGKKFWGVEGEFLYFAISLHILDPKYTDHQTSTVNHQAHTYTCTHNSFFPESSQKFMKILFLEECIWNFVWRISKHPSFLEFSYFIVLIIVTCSEISGWFTSMRRTNHGLSMDFPWIFHGFSMDFPWIFHGFSMDFPWIFHGFSMDFPLTFHGLFTDFPRNFRCIGQNFFLFTFLWNFIFSIQTQQYTIRLFLKIELEFSQNFPKTHKIVIGI